MDKHGRVQAPVSDLRSPGLHDYVLDILYITIFAQLASLFSPRVWTIYLLVCILQLPCLRLTLPRVGTGLCCFQDLQTFLFHGGSTRKLRRTRSVTDEDE